MKLMIYFLLPILAVACSTVPKCQNPPGAQTIFASGDSCAVRIKQVVIGSEAKLPATMLTDALAGYELEWTDSALENGIIRLGHFSLVPPKAAR